MKAPAGATEPERNAAMIRQFSLASAAALALLAATAGAQANSSGTIKLQGTVAKVCTVSVVDAGAMLNLVSGENRKPVGTVVENCNSGQGYDVTLTSTHNGQLRSGNDNIAYQVVYDEQSNALSSPWTLTRSNAQFGKQVNVMVTVPAKNNAIAGTYTDTITIQIAAK